MDDAQPLSTLLNDAQDFAGRVQKTDVFLLRDLALEQMGEAHKARAGAALPPGRGPFRLRVVTAGVVAMRREGQGLCTAMVGRGQPLAGSGAWITDGAFVDLSFAQVSEHLGAERALALWEQAAAYSRTAVEVELGCAVRHSAAQRFARWLSQVLGVQNEALLTQAQLAELSGLQRTSVCAAMASLQTKQALKVIRGRIRLRSLQALESQACDCRAPADIGATTGEEIVSADGARPYCNEPVASDEGLGARKAPVPA
jgi:hypothetical protein